MLRPHLFHSSPHLFLDWDCCLSRQPCSKPFCLRDSRDCRISFPLMWVAVDAVTHRTRPEPLPPHDRHQPLGPDSTSRRSLRRSGLRRCLQSSRPPPRARSPSGRCRAWRSSSPPPSSRCVCSQQQVSTNYVWCCTHCWRAVQTRWMHECHPAAVSCMLCRALTCLCAASRRVVCSMCASAQSWPLMLTQLLHILRRARTRRAPN
jgi:hypothetical protein